jgi:hypothetical protein
LLLGLFIVLSLPSIQTKIAKHYTEKINKDFGTKISIEKIALTIFGTIKIKQVLVKDHQKDTLIYVKQLNTNILDFNKWQKGDLIFGDIRLNDFYLNMKNYKNEKFTNLDKFIEAFDDGKPSSGKFLMMADAIYIENGKYLLTDENRKDPKDLDLKDLQARLTNFIIKGPNVDFEIEKFKFKDHRGIDLENLQSTFSYTKKNIILKNLKATTKYSELTGNIKMSYDRKDLGDFNNKVNWDFDLINSKIGSNDVYCFYKDIGKNKTFLVNTKMYGTLNNFWLKNLSFQDGNESRIKGNFKLVNSFGKEHQKFQLDTDFKTLESSYDHLISFLPNLLAKNLPIEIKKLKRFTLSGITSVNAKDLKANVKLNSVLGFLETNLEIKNVYDPKNATYKGIIKTNQFDIGTLINDKKIGKSTLNIEVDGKGFKQEYINTNFKGTITNLYYNKYQYKNIEIDGFAKKPLFSGKINSNDPNLKMKFDGTIDFSKNENIYQFESDITYANLKNLNLIKDTTAIFRGKIVSNLAGSTIDNMQGLIKFKDANYQNNKKVFNINDVSISSKFDMMRERTLTINAPNILEGEIIGKFNFGSIPKMIQNALGSIYTHYKKHNILNNNYMKFNFLVNNQLLELFYPEIQLERPSNLRGNINTNTNEFKLFCNADLINMNQNKFYNLKMELDNKNPVYNAYITLDSIQNKRYTISDFNLLNITEKDTMYMRSEFKGGKKKNDYYNLDFYHTIDANNQNIIGFNKSEINIKNYMWYLNEHKNTQNRIIIDENISNFYFEGITLSHENEEAQLNGTMIGSSNKDLKLNLKNLNINKLLPFEVGPELDGNLSGNLSLFETAVLYEPKADLLISNFKLNKNILGDLKFDVKSNEAMNILDVNLNLENNSIKTISGNGQLDISSKKPKLDFDIKVNQLDISFLNKFSESIVSNVRGLASGTVSVQKDLFNPEINGRLYLNKGGMKVDYTEVDYQITEESIIDITQNLFTFRKIELTDLKHKTKGILTGYMKHQGFENWYFDIDIISNYFNIFDKKDNDEAPFYGTAFISGTSSIKGPMNAIVLDIKAYSEKGTNVKIPITNSTNSQENAFISYLTLEEKFKKNIKIQTKKEEYYGLAMNFDLYIDNDAAIEVILNKETGHAMSGVGKGNLLIAINTLGKFNMYGDIIIDKGDYNFSYQNLIKKKFNITPNSRISWDGDPFKADLKIRAIYDNVYANPSVLLENATLNGRKVQVEVGIDLIGKLDNLNPDFTINFPKLDPILASEVNTKLADRDTRTSQAMFLLGSGTFISDQTNLAQSFFANNALETASSIWGNIFNEKNGTISITPDIVLADNNPNAQSTGSYGFRSNIKLSERVSINGKIGIPTGNNINNTLIGNVELLYRINDDGSLNFRAFNRENDINYIGEGIGFTQGVGLTYQFDFNNIADFRRKIKSIFKKENKNSNPNNDFDNDNRPNEDAIETAKEKKKKVIKPTEEPPEL